MDCFNWDRVDKAGGGSGRLQLNAIKIVGGGSWESRCLAAATYSIMLHTLAKLTWRQSEVCYPQVVPPRARRRLKRPDIDWQSLHTCSAKVSCLSYLTLKKTGKELQNIRFPSMLMLGCQAASTLSRLKYDVLILDVLRFNLTLSDQAITLSTSGCKDATIMSSLRVIRYVNRSSA